MLFLFQQLHLHNYILMSKPWLTACILARVITPSSMIFWLTISSFSDATCSRLCIIEAPNPPGRPLRALRRIAPPNVT